MSLSNYFHPDEVMLKLAGLISEGLQYHAAAMSLVSADDQIDDVYYDEAMEEVEKLSADPKMLVATAFRDNKIDMIMLTTTAQGGSAGQSTRQFYTQQLTLNVSYKKMRRRFRKEVARITDVPVLKPVANSNTTIAPDEIVMIESNDPVSLTNVTSMHDWRGRLRKTA